MKNAPPGCKTFMSSIFEKADETYNIISLRKSDRQFKKKISNKHLLISIFEYHVSHPNLHYRQFLFNAFANFRIDPWYSLIYHTNYKFFNQQI
jgi:hypothetical protein